MAVLADRVLALRQRQHLLGTDALSEAVEAEAEAEAGAPERPEAAFPAAEG